MTYTLQLENIHCKSCANNIREELEEMLQVKDAHVDLANQTVTFDTDATLLDKIITTLEELGFPLKKQMIES